MSPPKVTLAGKDVPKPPVEVEVGSADMPSVITVDQDSERIRRHNRRSRKLRWSCCGISILLLGAIVVFCTYAALRGVHRRHHKDHHRKQWSLCYGTKRLNENVLVDHRNRLIKVAHAQDHEAQQPAMEILHEYSRGMVAYKDVDRKICYIDRLDETFEDGYERWEAYEKHDRKDQKTLRVISHPIEVEVLRHVMDKHITLHCSDSTSHWVMEIEEKEVTTEMRVVRV